MPKYTSKRETTVCGYTKVNVDKKHNTSKRLLAGKNAMMQTLSSTTGSRAQRRREKAKQLLYSTMATHPMGLVVDCPSQFDGLIYDFAPPELTLYNNTENGFVHWIDKENGVASCIVVPRSRLCNMTCRANSDEVVEALETLQRTEKNCKRGKNQTGRSFNKYTIYGWKVLQARGYSQSAVKERDPKAADSLQRFAKRLEELAASVVPSRWLRAVKAASVLVEFPTIESCTFGAGIASSIDYCAPSHVDDDFYITVHQLNVKGCFGCPEIAQYFCFPTCGYAVALRPGDVLVFNPHVHHCLSKKSPQYAGKRVHVSSLYTKTKHVTGNDKSIELTEKQKLYADMDQKLTSSNNH